MKTILQHATHNTTSTTKGTSGTLRRTTGICKTFEYVARPLLAQRLRRAPGCHSTGCPPLPTNLRTDYGADSGLNYGADCGADYGADSARILVPGFGTRLPNQQESPGIPATQGEP